MIGSTVTAICASFIIMLTLGSASGKPPASEASYARLLATYVSPSASGVNLVDYAAWQRNDADKQALESYIADLQNQSPSAMKRDQAYVYWINLYNASTLNVILDNYPVGSIRDIKSDGTSLLDFKAFFGPWRTRLVTVEDEPLSLDDIEHNILRAQFDDPRSHYALNCAAIGCPDLKTTPWTAENLESDLDNAAKAFVNHARGVKVEPGGTLHLSSIYVWFKRDFGGTDEQIIAHLRKYAAPELAQRLEGRPRIMSDSYDWSLNDSSAGQAVR